MSRQLRGALVGDTFFSFLFFFSILSFCLHSRTTQKNIFSVCIAVSPKYRVAQKPGTRQSTFPFLAPGVISWGCNWRMRLQLEMKNDRRENKNGPSSEDGRRRAARVSALHEQRRRFRPPFGKRGEFFSPFSLRPFSTGVFCLRLLLGLSCSPTIWHRWGDDKCPVGGVERGALKNGQSRLESEGVKFVSPPILGHVIGDTFGVSVSQQTNHFTAIRSSRLWPFDRRCESVCPEPCAGVGQLACVRVGRRGL